MLTLTNTPVLFDLCISNPISHVLTLLEKLREDSFPALASSNEQASQG